MGAAAQQFSPRIQAPSVLPQPQLVALSSRLQDGCRASRHYVQVPGRKKREGPTKSFPGSSTCRISGLGHVATQDVRASGKECFQPVTCGLEQNQGKEGKMHPGQTGQGCPSKMQEPIVPLLHVKSSRASPSPGAGSGSCFMSSTPEPSCGHRGASAPARHLPAMLWLQPQPGLSRSHECPCPLLAHRHPMTSHSSLRTLPLLSRRKTSSRTEQSLLPPFPGTLLCFLLRFLAPTLVAPAGL